MQLYQLNIKVFFKEGPGLKPGYTRYAVQFKTIDEAEAKVTAREKVESYQKENEGQKVEAELFMIGKEISLT